MPASAAAIMLISHGGGDDAAEIDALEPVPAAMPIRQPNRRPFQQPHPASRPDDPKRCGCRDRGSPAPARSRSWSASRIAAHPGHDRHQHGERHDLFDRHVENADDGGGEKGGDEIDRQPDHARARGDEDRVGQLFVADAARRMMSSSASPGSRRRRRRWSARRPDGHCRPPRRRRRAGRIARRAAPPLPGPSRPAPDGWSRA